ncbi:hypothetical protein BDN70DRAFT_816944 [Pholiota conissans]|uniref:Uncharacterized protein n=1 Tax=Pholiota conissans TaxID=109636 RepID=A0A9P6CU59_9AGAR|nr:hypothetical protein BDN70DRAFT_816944 [Pholiota conissans]
MAWKVQTTETDLPFDAEVNVDLECSSHLEREMFEVSKHAGVARDYQWGLDVWDHQDWDPYDSYWSVGDRTVSESCVILFRFHEQIRTHIGYL